VANVTRHFARYNGLEIGDKIIIDLRDRVHSVILTIFPEFDDWRNFEMYYGLELEIVGIIDIQRPIETTAHEETMFVPYSIFPASFIGSSDGAIRTIDYSFVLNSPMNQANFILEYRDILTAKGHTLLFIENNAENFATSAYPLRQSARINLILFAVLTVAILFVAIFIYLRQCRKNFAIARAMGIPSKKLRRQMLTPVLLFWVPSVVVIGGGAWGFAHNIAAETLTALSD
jgi:ABC-type antimicrobial peptide transport system permease subunit